LKHALQVNFQIMLLSEVIQQLIKNLGIKGSVTTKYRAGGIVGQAAGTTLIENCYFDGTLVSTDGSNGFSGGILAYNNWTIVTINNCYVTGTITSNCISGGIIGRSNGTCTTNINNSYVTASVSGTIVAGGISGDAYKTSTGNKLNINNSVAANLFINGATGNRINGTASPLVAASFTNNFALENTLVNSETVSGTANNNNGLNKTLAELQTTATYTGLGWNLTGTWAIRNGSSYPYLKWQEKEFVIAAGASESATDYITSPWYTNIVIESNGTTTGQLTGAENLTVNGVVKLVKTFPVKQWYTIGFPFALASITADWDATAPGEETLTAWNDTDGDFWLKTVNPDASGFTQATDIVANTGYIIQFPDDSEIGAIVGKPVTFTSVLNPVLAANHTVLTQKLASSNYTLEVNPGLQNVSSYSGFKGYYEHSTNGSSFLAGQNTDNRINSGLQPFEALLVAGSELSTPLRSIVGVEDGNVVTRLDTPQSNDPIVATKYYNLQGQPAGADNYSPVQAGIYIIKQIHASGKITTARQLIVK
jgi:hypothetical protein